MTGVCSPAGSPRSVVSWLSGPSPHESTEALTLARSYLRAHHASLRMFWTAWLLSIHGAKQALQNAESTEDHSAGDRARLSMLASARNDFPTRVDSGEEGQLAKRH